MAHKCASELTINGSDNGLWPSRRQPIIETNAGILLIRPLGTQFSEISFETSYNFIQENAVDNVCEMSAIFLGLSVLKCSPTANSVGPTLAQRGYCRLHVGPTWAQRALLSGFSISVAQTFCQVLWSFGIYVMSTWNLS